MKVLIKTEFRDKDNYLVVYKPGHTVEFEDDRAKRIIALGYADEIKPKTKKAEPLNND